MSSNQNIKPSGSSLQKSALQKVLTPFKYIDKKVDGGLVFFIKHYGKSRFMVAMSKRIQSLGIERVWDKGPKAFIYFFMFYLVRDTILYIVIPIFFANMTSN